LVAFDAYVKILLGEDVVAEKVAPVPE